MSELKFETLQLHVGQENPDPATDARARYRSRLIAVDFVRGKHRGRN